MSRTASAMTSPAAEVHRLIPTRLASPAGRANVPRERHCPPVARWSTVTFRLPAVVATMYGVALL
ncbi:hypothetical protein ACH4OY_19360 [Micromonospora rubida]|uniref:Uncharacterized protein n=1 Tax=Micromonospora rubida TaxID=2697657 RepID=A0ABW7SM94_9ACTN